MWESTRSGSEEAEPAAEAPTVVAGEEQVHARSLCVCSVAPRTVACQAPLSVGFSGKNIRGGCHLLLQGIVLTQGLNPRLL